MAHYEKLISDLRGNGLWSMMISFTSHVMSGQINISHFLFTLISLNFCVNVLINSEQTIYSHGDSCNVLNMVVSMVIFHKGQHNTNQHKGRKENTSRQSYIERESGIYHVLAVCFISSSLQLPNYSTVDLKQFST